MASVYTISENAIAPAMAGISIPYDIQYSLIGKRQQSWDRMAALTERAGRGIRGLSPEELRELALLYRQTANDLSIVRQDGSAPGIEKRLNDLLARAHAFFYSSRRHGLGTLRQFFLEDYPRLFRKLLPFTLASLLLFTAGGVWARC